MQFTYSFKGFPFLAGKSIVVHLKPEEISEVKRESQFKNTGF